MAFTPGKNTKIMCLIPVLCFLCACAHTGSLSHADREKNSLPVMERDLIEEVRTIAVPPFHRDQNNWQGITYEVLSSVKRLSVIPAGKTDAAVRNIRKNLSGLTIDDRPEFLVRVGRSVRADAVINGILISREGQSEIILQLISSRDSRVLWWQAVDLAIKERPSPADQKKVLSSILSSLVESAGKKDRPAGSSALQPQTKPEPGPKADTQQKQERKSRSDKKPDRGPKPPPSPDDIGPM